jgi:hypothetical protein
MVWPELRRKESFFVASGGEDGLEEMPVKAAVE